MSSVIHIDAPFKAYPQHKTKGHLYYSLDLTRRLSENKNGQERTPILILIKKKQIFFLISLTEKLG